MMKNFDDCKEETREFGESNKDLSERIASIQVEWRIERESVNERINKIKAENKSEIEQAEIEVQKSKDNVKEQIRKTQKMRKGYEIEKEQNLEIIQTIKDENNELKNKLKTKEECIKELKRKLEKKPESDQWSEHEKMVNLTPKAQRIPKLIPQAMEVDTTI